MSGSIKNKNKKNFLPYYVIVGICGVIVISVLAVIIFVILFFNSLSQSASQAEKTNEAKRLMIPVESYAQSQGWKSVYTINTPVGGDNSVPGYNEVFLTTQTPNEVEQDIFTFLNEKGYHMSSQSDSSMAPDAVDPSDINLQGTATNGNEVDVTISHIGYEDENGSTIKIIQGMTAVAVYFAYNNGYLDQSQKEPPSNIGCVGNGCH
jgi:hypothetical protein